MDSGLDRRNALVAERLDEIARLLLQQGANAFRIEAYRRAAVAMRALRQPVEELLAAEGVEGLEGLSGVGPGLARAIHELVRTGRLALLERLRSDLDPVGTLSSVPGIGPATAERLYEDLGIGTLEDLETAAHDGRLAAVPGFGEKRLAAIRDTLATRLGRLRRPVTSLAANAPPVSEILDVDAEYRTRAAAGSLHRIAPRRLNPTHTAWLPILHTFRGNRHYTAVYSNTARAHAFGRIHDWVVLYCDGPLGERQYTVVTAEAGPLRGRRVVRGREAECVQRQPQARPATTTAAPEQLVLIPG